MRRLAFAGPLPDTSRLRLSDLSGPVELRLSPRRQALLLSLMNGWEVQPWHGHDTEPLLSLTEESGGYVLGGSAAARPATRGDFADAVCGFLAEFVRVYVDERPGRLCLHAASATFGGQLVVFPSTFRAGKSTLCAALAAAGARLAGDDVLMIDSEDGGGESLGFPPRLRLPLPDNLAPASLSFIEKHIHFSGKRYRYLDLGPAALARKGEKFPIRSFVLLDRKVDGPAELSPLRKADALRTVLHQNFARAIPPHGILECLTKIVNTAETLRLGYSSSEEAAELLAAHFHESADWSCRHFPARNRNLRRDMPAPSSAGQFRRRDGIVGQEVEAQTFLAVEASGRILSLNSTASALWRALEEPATDAELKELMQMAFPEAPAVSIAEDVDEALRRLIDEGLIIRT